MTRIEALVDRALSRPRAEHYVYLFVAFGVEVLAVVRHIPTPWRNR